MRAVALLAPLTLCAACARPPENPTSGVDIVAAAPFVKYRWSFDPAPHFPPSPPSPIESTASRTRFLAVLGKWGIERDESAPSSPHLMRQRREDGHPSRLLVEQLGFAAVTATAKCRIDGAREDGSCGVVFAARSESDYFVARIDDRGVQLAHVGGAIETVLGSYAASLARDQWHALEVSSRDGFITVSVDGTLAVSKQAPTSEFGRIGLFAKGNASFDDLTAISLRHTKQM
jgi:hypothetical protein